MPIGGLIGKAIDLKSRKPTRNCPRCGLRYPQDQEKCPHCGDMSASELAQFKSQLEAETRGTGNLGRLFLLASGGLLVALLLWTSA